MALIDTLVVLGVSPLVGALGIYAGARLVTGDDDYSHAILTAIIGAVVWAVAPTVLLSTRPGRHSSALGW